MNAATVPQPGPVFESFGEAAELLGAVQVNFFVPGPNREYAITINDPALDRAVAELGLEPSADSRRTVARELGRALLVRKLQANRGQPLNFYGPRLFDDYPGVVDDVRAALAAA